MGILLRWKNFNYMLEIDILRNDSHISGFPEVIFEGLGVLKTPRRHSG